MPAPDCPLSMQYSRRVGEGRRRVQRICHRQAVRVQAVTRIRGVSRPVKRRLECPFGPLMLSVGLVRCVMVSLSPVMPRKTMHAMPVAPVPLMAAELSVRMALLHAMFRNLMRQRMPRLILGSMLDARFARLRADYA